MKFIRRNIKIISIIIFIIIIISLIGLKIYLNHNSKEPKKEEILPEEIIVKEETEEKVEIIQKVHVDIKGAVKNPGVYEVDNDKKVIDVVNISGGLTDQADTSMINLAKQVTNEMVIIIYTKEEVKKYTTQEEIIKVIDKECVCPEIKNDACINNIKENNSTTETTKNESSKSETITTEKININTSTLEELQNLNGIGEGKAKAIIEYREEVGKFNSIEELKEVSGIGEALYEKIKDNITV